MEKGLRWVLGLLIVLNVLCAGLLSARETKSEIPLAELDAATIRLLAEIPNPQSAVTGLAQTAPPTNTPPRQPDAKADPIGEIVAVQDGGRASHRTQMCMAAGPFETMAALRGLRERIQSAGATVHVVEEQVEAPPDYLVYIEPASSRDVARRVLQELKAQSIDSYLIRDGDLTDAISVGVFTQNELAKGQRERIAALGYEVSLRDLNRSHTVYRLLAQGTDVAPIDADSGTNWVPCDEIAAVDRIL